MHFEDHRPVELSPSPLADVYSSVAEMRASLVEVALACSERGITLQSLLPEVLKDQSGQSAQEAMVLFIGDLLGSKDRVLLLDCYAIVFGIGEMYGMTLQAVANSHGVKKQYIDKICREIRIKLNVECSWNRKVETGNYSLRNHRHTGDKALSA